jgi:hypothetical protein
MTPRISRGSINTRHVLEALRIDAIGRQQRGSKISKAALAALGTVVLGTGATAVFASNNSGGSAALIGAGVALIVVAYLSNRITSLEAGGVKLQLAAEKLVAADKAEASGDQTAARLLRREAAMLLGAAASTAASFEELKSTEPPSWERTRQLAAVVEPQGEALAAIPSLDVETVSDLFNAGGEGNRVLALIIMQHRPALANLPQVLTAIESAESGFEQFHALKVAISMLKSDDVDEEKKSRLRESIERAAQSTSLRTAGPSRTRILDEIRRLA